MTNKVIIGGREIGKTTFLYNKSVELVNSGSKVIILDSATDHVEKSLLKKVDQKFNNVKVLSYESSNDIVITKMLFEEYIKEYKNYFPFCDVLENKNKNILFDLSYFLELGYYELEERNNETGFYLNRKIYNDLSYQIVACILLMNFHKQIPNNHIFMDEIEIPNCSPELLYYLHFSEILASIHPENSNGDFYKSFQKIKIPVFKK